MKKNIITMFLMGMILLVSLSLSSAQPPFQQSAQNIGIIIETPVIEYHPFNQSFEFNVHAHNSTSGLVLRNDTTTCTLHVYQPSNGEHIFNGIMDFNAGNNIDFELELDDGNFTEIGQYAVLFYCAVPGEIGGFFEYGFDVISSTFIPSTGDSILYSLFSIIVFGLFCIVSFFIISIPSENEKDDKGFETKVIRLKYLRPILMVVLYILMVTLLNFLNGIAINFSSLSMFSGILGFIFETMMRLSWAFTILIIVWIVYMLVKDTNINRQLDRFDKFDPFKDQ